MLSVLIAGALVRRVSRAMGMHFKELPLIAERIVEVLPAST
jgi:hypothetical protein